MRRRRGLRDPSSQDHGWVNTFLNPGALIDSVPGIIVPLAYMLGQISRIEIRLGCTSLSLYSNLLSCSIVK
jgi:hypothetical protein